MALVVHSLGFGQLVFICIQVLFEWPEGNVRCFVRDMKPTTTIIRVPVIITINSFFPLNKSHTYSGHLSK